MEISIKMSYVIDALYNRTPHKIDTPIKDTTVLDTPKIKFIYDKHSFNKHPITDRPYNRHSLK